MSPVSVFLFVISAAVGWTGSCTTPAGRTEPYAYIVPPANLAPAPYSEWAHHHWVWLSSDRANQSALMDYVDEYLAHCIPVGAVNIDSAWETGFNDFVFNSEKYPNASDMIKHFHSKSIKVIVWVTSMVDINSPNYEEGLADQYYVKDVLGRSAVIKWWHGSGSLLDYSNPAAVDWWHKQLDKVLELGIDGWKCDGTDPYIIELVAPRGSKGFLTYREYADAYYGDFFNYTRAKVGNGSLIMSRPVDGYKFIFLDFSPRSVMFSGWVGDQDPTFKGLEAALKRYLQSAWAGYANFGSDIGGYRSGSDPLGRSRELFLRWAQVGAFSPLMENGGNKEHRPWMFSQPNETTYIYRTYVATHLMLVPYLLSTGSKAFETGTSSITPLAKHDNFIEKLIDDFKPDTYNYLLGDHILVCPVISNPANVTVTFPSGSGVWFDFWNSSNCYQGGDTHVFNPDLATLPVFIQAGALLPLRITDSLTGFGDQTFGDALTLYVDWPDLNVKHTVEIRDSGLGMIAQYWMASDSTELHFEVTAHPREKLIIVFQHIPRPRQIDGQFVYDSKIESSIREHSSLESLVSLGCGFWWDSNRQRVVIRPGSIELGASLTIYF